MSAFSSIKYEAESASANESLLENNFSNLGENEINRLMKEDLLGLDLGLGDTEVDMIVSNDDLDNLFLERRSSVFSSSELSRCSEGFGEVTSSLSNVRLVGEKCKRKLGQELSMSPKVEVKLEEGSQRKGKVLSNIHMPNEEPSRLANSRDIDLLDENYQALKKLNCLNSCLSFSSEPPLEVRTRTKNENRTFGLVLSLDLDSLLGDLNAAATKEIRNRKGCYAIIEVKLVYAKDINSVLPILGGTCTQKVDLSPGIGDKRVVNVEFSDLSVSVASPKHSEKEFSLCVRIQDIVFPGISLDMKSLVSVNAPIYSRPFYAFSHKSVLRRRKAVTIRAASHLSCPSTGGISMHVVGAPFVRSDRLQCVFKIRSEHYKKYCQSSESNAELAQVSNDDKWVSLRAANLEYFSDSVLFFQVPTELGVSPCEDVPAYIQVTNDGRNFSNALEFTFTAVDKSGSPYKRPRILSRM